MDQMNQLLRLLKKTDSLTIPIFDFNACLKQKALQLLMAAGASDGTEDGQAKKEAVGTSVSVEIQDSDHVARTAVANELPVWHTHSTITGEKVRGADFPVLTIDEENNTSASEATAEALENYYAGLQHNGSGSPLKRVKLDESSADEEAVEVEDEPFVVVGGESVFLKDITDEHKGKMTAEEYAQYYEVFIANS